MVSGNDWQDFFDGHAPVYLENCFTRNTLAEVEFLLEELTPPEGGSILDVGCGTGRHDVELAKRGYQVTGVDQSAGMLAEARKAAEQAGVRVEWIQTDATRFEVSRPFDAAICLCEGAFALLGAQDDPTEHDLAILRNVHAALRPGAGFLLTTLNGYRKARQHSQEDVETGVFDPLSLSEFISMDCETPAGKRTVRLRERGYMPTELRLLLQLAGFTVRHIWGGTAGNWGRRPIDLDEFEIMVVSERPAERS